MTIDTDDFDEKMRQTRYRDGRLERLEGDKWVPVPVLKLDKLGRDAAARELAQRSLKRREEYG